MRILADENIPLVQDAFSDLGEVATLSGRAITPDAVREADILVVRSITQVDSRLLDGSRVRFVGTATIGTDHIDQEYLKERGIGFSAAPGSNAESVAEYVTAALLQLSLRLGRNLDSLAIGIVGVGNVGSRVARNCRSLGMTVLLNDPPLQRATANAGYLPLEALRDADIITFHVPLTNSGPDKTRHLADAAFLGDLKKNTILINTSRGAVVDNTALLQALESGHLADAVLDVWEGEPNISIPLLQRVAIATPHIAGYSYDGKVLGTRMIRDAAGTFFNIPSTWQPSSHQPDSFTNQTRIATLGKSQDDGLREAVTSCYDIMLDDTQTRALVSMETDKRPLYFDQLRKNYRVRREFDNTEITLEPFNQEYARALAALRFQVSPPS